MAVIVLNSMGGVRPSTLPRALPDGGPCTGWLPDQGSVPVCGQGWQGGQEYCHI